MFLPSHFFPSLLFFMFLFVFQTYCLLTSYGVLVTSSVMWEGPSSLSLSVPSSYLQVPSLLSFAFPQHISPSFAVKCSNAVTVMWSNKHWLTFWCIPANFAFSWSSLSCFTLIFWSSSSLWLFPPIAVIHIIWPVNYDDNIPSACGAHCRDCSATLARCATLSCL